MLLHCSHSTIASIHTRGVSFELTAGLIRMKAYNAQKYRTELEYL